MHSLLSKLNIKNFKNKSSGEDAPPPYCVVDPLPPYQDNNFKSKNQNNATSVIINVNVDNEDTYSTIITDHESNLISHSQPLLGLEKKQNSLKANKSSTKQESIFDLIPVYLPHLDPNNTNNCKVSTTSIQRNRRSNNNPRKNISSKSYANVGSTFGKKPTRPLYQNSNGPVGCMPIGDDTYYTYYGRKPAVLACIPIGDHDDDGGN